MRTQLCHVVAHLQVRGPARIPQLFNLTLNITKPMLLMLAHGTVDSLQRLCLQQRRASLPLPLDVEAQRSSFACLSCRVRDFEVVDIFPFGVAFDWDKDGEPTSVVLFERNCPIPSAKVLTFHRCAISLYCNIPSAYYGLGLAPAPSALLSIPSAKELTLHRCAMRHAYLPCCITCDLLLGRKLTLPCVMPISHGLNTAVIASVQHPFCTWRMLHVQVLSSSTSGCAGRAHLPSQPGTPMTHPYQRASTAP